MITRRRRDSGVLIVDSRTERLDPPPLPLSRRRPPDLQFYPEPHLETSKPNPNAPPPPFLLSPLEFERYCTVVIALLLHFTFQLFLSLIFSSSIIFIILDWSGGDCDRKLGTTIPKLLFSCSQVRQLKVIQAS